jgi:ParB family transcriptional regulator, chromosome partitioning protein
LNKRLGRGLDALISVNTNDQDTVNEVNIKEIRPNPYQPRKIFEEKALQELTASILEHGIIQPLIVRKSIKGYELVAGERRLRAAQLAKLDKVPVVIKEFTDEQIMEIALIENLQRENLNPMEIAVAYQKLVKSFSLTQEDLAQKVGKSRPHVANFLRLLQLPEEVQTFVSEGQLSMGHARALLGIEEDKQRIDIAKEVANKGLSVRELEELIKRLNGEKRVPRETKVSVTSPYIRNFEERLREKFGTAVNVKPVGNNGKGKIEISFFSEDDLTRILDLIEKNNM